MSNSSDKPATSTTFAQLLAEYEATHQPASSESKLVHGVYQGNGLVDLGTKFDGVIISAELEGCDLVEQKTYPFIVVSQGREAEEGEKDGQLVQLSYLKGRTMAHVQSVSAAGGNLKVNLGRITRTGNRHSESAKGRKVSGLTVSVGEGLSRIGGFLPFSGVVPAWCNDSMREAAIRSFTQKHETVDVKVLAFNAESGRHESPFVVALPNALVKADPAKRPTIEDIELHRTYTGIVCNIMPFGVFVDIGGIQGLVHISEIPGQTTQGLTSGEFVEVTAIKFVDGKAGFSLTRPMQVQRLAAMKVGDVIDGVVRNTVRNDCFVTLDEALRLDAILRGRDCAHTFKAVIGDRIRARVLSVDAQTGRIALGQPQVLSPVEHAESAIAA
jgi:ribosomal protein S1